MKNILYLFLFLFIGVSCVPKNKLVYLQKADDHSDTTQFYFSKGNSNYKLVSGDVLDVKIVSLEKEANEILMTSVQGAQGQSAAGGSAGDAFYLTGFIVDKKGMLELPLIGKVETVNKTILEVKEIIDSELLKYLRKGTFYVSVKLGGIRYSALGEFNNPGKYTVLQSDLSIIDAIANAGDLTDFADRKEVKLIRNTPKGVKICEVNLLDRSILTSSYYWLQPGDVLYVEPLKVKTWGFGTNGAQTISLILSVLTSSLLVLTYINNTK